MAEKRDDLHHRENEGDSQELHDTQKKIRKHPTTEDRQGFNAERGAYLKKLRKANGWVLKDMEEKFKEMFPESITLFKKSTISYYEKGRNLPPENFLQYALLLSEGLENITAEEIYYTLFDYSDLLKPLKGYSVLADIQHMDKEKLSLLLAIVNRIKDARFGELAHLSDIADDILSIQKRANGE